MPLKPFNQGESEAYALNAMVVSDYFLRKAAMDMLNSYSRVLLANILDGHGHHLL